MLEEVVWIVDVQVLTGFEELVYPVGIGVIFEDGGLVVLCAYVADHLVVLEVSCDRDVQYVPEQAALDGDNFVFACGGQWIECAGGQSGLDAGDDCSPLYHEGLAGDIGLFLEHDLALGAGQLVVDGVMGFPGQRVDQANDLGIGVVVVAGQGGGKVCVYCSHSIFLCPRIH